ncbi:MAG: YkvA family protein [Rhizobiaceae bacterium]
MRSFDDILSGRPGDEDNVRTRFWPHLRRALGRLPFAEDLAAAWFCATDPLTPFTARATLMAALGYFVLPFDAVPDFLVMVGFTDDMAVLTAAIAAIAGNITPKHRQKARQAIEDLS